MSSTCCTKRDSGPRRTRQPRGPGIDLPGDELVMDCWVDIDEPGCLACRRPATRPERSIWPLTPMHAGYAMSPSADPAPRRTATRCKSYLRPDASFGPLSRCFCCGRMRIRVAGGPGKHIGGLQLFGPGRHANREPENVTTSCRWHESSPSNAPGASADSGRPSA